MNNLFNAFLCFSFLFLSIPSFSNSIDFFTDKHPIISKALSSTDASYTDETDCPKRKKYCEGSRTWNDGAKYTGEFRYGEPSGSGIYSWKDGSNYNGHFLDGYRHGSGTQNLENGDAYTGKWLFGLMHGEGTYLWKDGSKYEGEFYEGLMHGKGTIHLANGEVYDGAWKNGLSHGEGTFTRIDGSKYNGRSKEGQRHGKGVITWRTGDVFIGSWKNGKVHKSGTFQYNNGDRYICIWEDGVMTGDATYIFVNGKEVNGDLKAVERSVTSNPDLLESISDNLALTWYAIALEYKAMKAYNMAADNLRIAQKYIAPSSDLNKLIYQQLIIIDKEIEKEGL